MLRLDDLQVFVRTADRGSLSAAAREIGISPALASAAVKRLEGGAGLAPAGPHDAFAELDAGRHAIPGTRARRLAPAARRPRRAAGRQGQFRRNLENCHALRPGPQSDAGLARRIPVAPSEVAVPAQRQRPGGRHGAPASRRGHPLWPARRFEHDRHADRARQRPGAGGVARLPARTRTPAGAGRLVAAQLPALRAGRRLARPLDLLPPAAARAGDDSR